MIDLTSCGQPGSQMINCSVLSYLTHLTVVNEAHQFDKLCNTHTHGTQTNSYKCCT